MIPGALPDRHMDVLAREQARFISGLQVGEYFGSFRLEWIGPNRWLYHPGAEPFGFRRANGIEIIPQAMVTDGGSVPRLLHIFPGLSPWDFGPAYITHDWEFCAHDMGLPGQSFEEANLTLAEGVLTLMRRGYNGNRVPYRPSALLNIYAGVNTALGRKIWNAPAT